MLNDLSVRQIKAFTEDQRAACIEKQFMKVNDFVEGLSPDQTPSCQEFLT